MSLYFFISTKMVNFLIRSFKKLACFPYVQNYFCWIYWYLICFVTLKNDNRKSCADASWASVKYNVGCVRFGAISTTEKKTLLRLTLIYNSWFSFLVQVLINYLFGILPFHVYSLKSRLLAFMHKSCSCAISAAALVVRRFFCGTKDEEINALEK